MKPAVLAVDGGGSKVDAVLLTRTGDVIAAVRLNNLDHDGTDSDTYLDGVETAVNAVRDKAGLHPDRTVSPLGIIPSTCGTCSKSDSTTSASTRTFRPSRRPGGMRTRLPTTEMPVERFFGSIRLNVWSSP